MFSHLTSLKRSSSFKKRVTFFYSHHDENLGTVALYEYEGSHPVESGVFPVEVSRGNTAVVNVVLNRYKPQGRWKLSRGSVPW